MIYIRHQPRRARHWRYSLLGYLGMGIRTPMARGRSTKIISMMKWIRTSRLSTKISLSKFILACLIV